MNLSGQNDTNPSFYEAYKSAGFSAPLVLFGGLRALLGLASLLFSGSLVYATCKSKKLRSRCAFLIAFETTCNGVAFATNLPLFCVVASGTNFIAMRLCFWVQLVPVLGINLMLPAMLSVAVDRLLSVVAPIWLNEQNAKLWIGICVSACVVYALYALYLLLPIDLLQNPNLMVSCSLGDLYLGSAGLELYQNSVKMTGLTICCYAAIWLVMRRKRGTQLTNNEERKSVDYTRQLFTSLAAMVALVTVGYFLQSILSMALPHFQLSQVQTMFVAYALHCVTDFCGACNVPTLYLLSSTYRNAMNEVFGLDFKWSAA